MANTVNQAKKKAARRWGRLVALLVVLCVAAGAFVYGFVRVNNKFPAPTVQQAGVGETMEYNGFDVTLVESRMGTYSEIVEKDPDAIEMVGYEEDGNPTDPEKVLTFFVTLKVKNKTQEQAAAPLEMVTVHSLTWNNGMNLNATMAWNGEDANVFPMLQPEEEATVTYVYTAPYYMFPANGWEKAKADQYYLSLQVYPEYKEFVLDT